MNPKLFIGGVAAIILTILVAVVGTPFLRDYYHVAYPPEGTREARYYAICEKPENATQIMAWEGGRFSRWSESDRESCGTWVRLGHYQ